MNEEYGVQLDTDLTKYLEGLNEAVGKAKDTSDKIKSELNNIEIEPNTIQAEESLSKLSQRAKEASEHLKNVKNNLTSTLSSRVSSSIAGTSGLGSGLLATGLRTLMKTSGVLLGIALGYKLIIKRVKEYFEYQKRIKEAVENVLKAIGTGALKTLEFSFNAIKNFLNKSLSAYMSFDQQLSRNIQNVWAGFGSYLAPILEYLISLFQNLLAYVNAGIKVLTGIDFIARANTKALNGMADATSKVNKVLSKFDELNNIAQESSSGGGISGSTIEIPDIDTSSVESLAQRIKKLIEEDNWFGIGETIRDKIQGALNRIEWEKIKAGAKNLGTKFAETLNGLLTKNEKGENLGTTIGRTVGEAINTGLNFANAFVTTLNWGLLIDNIFDAIQETLDTIDWETLFTLATNIAKKIMEVIKKTLERLKELLPQIKAKIKEYMNSDEFRSIVLDIAKALENVDEIKDLIEDFVYDIYSYYIKIKREEENKQMNKSRQETKDQANKTFDELTGTVEKGEDAFLNTVKDRFKNTITKDIKDVGDTTKNSLNVQAEAVASEIKEKQEGLVKGIISNGITIPALDEIKKASANIKEETKTQTESLTPFMKSSGTNVFQAMSNGIKDVDLSSTVIDKTQGVLTTLSNTLGLEKGNNSEMGKMGKASITSFVDMLKSGNVSEVATSIAGDVVNPLNKELEINGSESGKTKKQGKSIVQSFLTGIKTGDVLAGIRNVFGPIANLISNLTTSAKTVAEKCGEGVASALMQGLKKGLTMGITSLTTSLKSSLNGLIWLFNRASENISRNFNINASGTIKIGDFQQKLSATLSSYMKQIPYLRVGTNEVYKEGLAYLHAGEKVVPADVAKGGYSYDNEETNELLKQLITILDEKDFNPYISVEDVGKASVNYINNRKRITGEAII